MSSVVSSAPPYTSEEIELCLVKLYTIASGYKFYLSKYNKGHALPTPVKRTFVTTSRYGREQYSVAYTHVAPKLVISRSQLRRRINMYNLFASPGILDNTMNWNHLSDQL